MHVLYYWRYYWQDRGDGDPPGCDLVQSSPAMLQLQRGDSLWAFCRRKDGCYVPATELRVDRVEENRPVLPYGRYTAWGDEATSRYFDVERCPDIEPLIRNLDLRAEADVLGWSFQGRNGVRVLTGADHQKLTEFCHSLPRASWE